MVLGGSLGQMKPTYSKYENVYHKRKNGTHLEDIPEPKKIETPQVQVQSVNVDQEMIHINPIREQSNNGIVENVTAMPFNFVPASPPIPDRYLVVVITCALFYLYTNHAPDRFRFFST